MAVLSTAVLLPTYTPLGWHPTRQSSMGASCIFAFKAVASRLFWSLYLVDVTADTLVCPVHALPWRSCRLPTGPPTAPSR